MKNTVESGNNITSVNYFLALVGKKEVVSMTTPLGILPHVYQKPEDISDEKEERKQLLNARFHFFGIAFTCLETLVNPNNENELFVISQIEGDLTHEEKFLYSLSDHKRFRVTIEKLGQVRSREFFNQYSKHFQTKPELAEVV